MTAMKCHCEKPWREDKGEVEAKLEALKESNEVRNKSIKIVEDIASNKVNIRAFIAMVLVTVSLITGCYTFQWATYEKLTTLMSNIQVEVGKIQMQIENLKGHIK